MVNISPKNEVLISSCIIYAPKEDLAIKLIPFFKPPRRRSKSKTTMATSSSKEDDEIARRLVEAEMAKIQMETQQRRKEKMRALIGGDAQDVASRKKGVGDSVQAWSEKGTNSPSSKKAALELDKNEISDLMSRKLAFSQNLERNANKGKTQHDEPAPEEQPLTEEQKRSFFENAMNAPSPFGAPLTSTSPPASPKPREDSYKDDFSSIEKEEVTMVGQEKHITVTGYNKEGRKLIKTKIILPKVKGETVSQNQYKGVAPSSPEGGKGAGNKLYSLSDIRQGKVEGIDKTRREQYLFPEEFEATFGMTKEKFNAQPKWKRDKLKREHRLF